MDHNNKFNDKEWVQYAKAACVAVTLYAALTHFNVIIKAFDGLMNLLSPVIYGLVIAYLISPLVRFIEKCVLNKVKGETLRHQLSNITAMITVVILLVILMSGLIPQLIESIILFVSNLNSYTRTLQDSIEYIVELGERYNLDMSILDSSSLDIVNRLVQFVSNNASRILEGSLNVTYNAMDFGLGLILAIYFLVFKKTIIKAYHDVLDLLLSKENYNKVTCFLSECNEIMTKYVVSDVLDAVIIGILNSVYMVISGTPYIVLISVVIGVTNLLPTFGPFIGAIIGGIILLFASPHSVIPFIIFTLVLQIVDGYVIKARLFGGALGVPGVWIILGIILGAKFFGFAGVLLSVPVVAILDYSFQLFAEKRKKQKQQGD